MKKTRRGRGRRERGGERETEREPEIDVAEGRAGAYERSIQRGANERERDGAVE